MDTRFTYQSLDTSSLAYYSPPILAGARDTFPSAQSSLWHTRSSPWGIEILPVSVVDSTPRHKQTAAPNAPMSWPRDSTRPLRRARTHAVCPSTPARPTTEAAPYCREQTPGAAAGSACRSKAARCRAAQPQPAAAQPHMPGLHRLSTRPG